MKNKEEIEGIRQCDHYYAFQNCPDIKAWVHICLTCRHISEIEFWKGKEVVMDDRKPEFIIENTGFGEYANTEGTEYYLDSTTMYASREEAQGQIVRLERDRKIGDFMDEEMLSYLLVCLKIIADPKDPKFKGSPNERASIFFKSILEERKGEP